MHSRGFTLVELVTVISIMAILFSIGMLNFNTYQKKAQIERQTSASSRAARLHTKTFLPVRIK